MQSNRNVLLVSLLVLLAFSLGTLFGNFMLRTHEDSKQKDTVEGESPSKNSADAHGGENVGSAQNDGMGTTISTDSLSEGQREMLEHLGIHDSSFTITREMELCAEEKLGDMRVQEIKSGATPTFSEGMTLVACYK